MDAHNLPPTAMPDLREKALNGHDLHASPHHSIHVDGRVQDQKFILEQKPQAKYSSGLWRKKREIDVSRSSLGR